MKQIQLVPIWYKGSLINAKIFNLYSINDNLTNSATFYFALFSGTLDELGIKLTEGNLVMDGTNYTSYSNSTDSNNFAYNWGALKLNLTILQQTKIFTKIGDTSLKVAVLEDGSRIINYSAIFRAFGRTKRGAQTDASRVHNMPAFLNENNLQPFVGKDLMSVHIKWIIFFEILYKNIALNNQG